MFDRIGWEFDFGFMPYGQHWRRHRRLFWQHFHPGVISKYNAVQQDVSRAFLGKLLTSPERLEEHIRQYVRYQTRMRIPSSNPRSDMQHLRRQYSQGRIWDRHCRAWRQTHRDYRSGHGRCSGRPHSGCFPRRILPVSPPCSRVASRCGLPDQTEEMA